MSKIFTTLLIGTTLLTLGSKKTKAEEVSQLSTPITTKNNLFSGIYFGINGGINRVKTSTDTKLTLKNSTTEELKKTHSKNIYFGGLYTGYNIPINNNVVIGTELTATYLPKIKVVYGIAFKPTLTFARTALSIVGGVEHMPHKNIEKHAYLAGAEVNQLLCNNTMVGAFYNYVLPIKKKVEYSKNNAITDNIEDIKTSAKLTQHRVGLKLSYLF